jgi:hypothetical protein
MNTAIANKIACRSNLKVEDGKGSLKHYFVKLMKTIHGVTSFDADGIFISKHWPYMWDKKDDGFTGGHD